MTLITRYVQYWWALPAAIVGAMLVVWLVTRAVRIRKKRLAKLGSNEMVRRLTPEIGEHRAFWRATRLGLAALLIGVALAGPRWGMEGSVIRQAGVDVVLAVDASTSMLATDEKPNRLAALKEDLRRLRERSPGDRFGLIAFAGKSYVLSPITVDNGALDIFLDNLDPNTVGQSGSSISSAIRQGVALLSLSQIEGDKALILLSDGESFESVENIEDAAKLAARNGVSLITVGYGTEQGSTIPIRENGVVTQKRDENGAVVVTRHNPDMLRRAASAAGGVFVPAGDRDKSARIRQALSRLRTTTRRANSAKNLAPQFQLFLIPAFLLLFLDSLLQSKRRKTGAQAKATAGLAAASFALMSVMLTSCTSKRDQATIELYNSGLELFKKNDTTKAMDMWRRSSVTKDGEVYYRSLFNVGYVHLADTARADSALANYKLVLLARPNDMDAKWNYELALRSKSNSGGGGGGGGGGSSDQPQPKPQQARRSPAQTRADMLLNSAELEEKEVQGNQQSRNVPTPPPRGKDW